MTVTRDYVIKYWNVQNRAFQYGFVRDFDYFCAQFSSVDQLQNNKCENCAFPMKNMGDYRILCA